jgi:hypothetical protein
MRWRAVCFDGKTGKDNMNATDTAHSVSFDSEGVLVMFTRKLALLPALCLTLLLAAMGCGGGSGGGGGSQPSAGLPEVVGATSLSLHYVEVDFAGSVGPDATQPGRYSITGPEGTPLAVHAARISDDPTRVILTTDAQQPVTYRLTMQTSGNVALISPQTGTNPEPQLQTAIALNNTQVLLTFDQPVAGGATTVASYRIVVPGETPTQDIGELHILSAALSADGMTVTLTTSPQKDLQYTVIVTNVASKSGGMLIDPTQNTATFFGMPPVDTTKPKLLSAASANQTTVILSFSEPMSLDTPDPTNFPINPPLVITGAQLSLFNTQIILTTAPQEPGIDYTVTVAAAVKDPAGNLIDPAANSATFRFVAPPALETAVALSNTTVLLTFSERLDQASAQTVGFYRIAAPDLAITAAVLQTDQISVLLTTGSQANTQYTVTVTNVHGRLGGAPIDPAHDTASFTGIPPFDNVAPQLLSAQATNSTTVLLTFSEPLLSLSNPLDNPAEDASNYSLAPAVTVIGAKLNQSKTQVLLTTLPLAEGIPFTLTVANVKDLAGNLIDPAHHSATFTFQGQAGLNDSDLPRVVGAASTGNNGIVVQFSRPMGDSATNPANYVIVTADVNPEVGALSVTAAAFTGADRTAVNLTTLSQNEVTYVLTVVNVKDFIGLPMAAKQIIAGVLLDPSSATFPGTPPVCPPRACTNGDPGVDGTGLCASDNDCTRTPPCKTGSCVGACTSSCTLKDTDGDGLTDNDEQRGWVVTIKLANGDTITRQVTSDPTLVDTDGDGLSDALEKNIGTDPRQVDTDGDGLSDYEEYNVIYSDPTMQDTDGDGISDNLEVEFFKTNALLADSDGDGYSDSQELFEMNRDPRIADLPRHQITVGSVRLQIDERFTTTDDNGNTTTEDSTTSTSLENDTSSDSSHFNQTVGNIFAQVEGGIDTCQSDCGTSDLSVFLNRLHLIGTIGGGAEFTTANTTDSSMAAMDAFQTSLDKARQVSTDHAVTREVVGASLSAEVTLENLSDVAFTLSNIEIRVATTDPQDPTHLVPVATLFPDSTLQTGNAQDFNIGPGQTRGPVIFSNTSVFPNLVEDLMRSPRGLVFTVANFDQTTEDGRNFAFGLQRVQERTADVSIDFGDGETKEFHAITAGVLNRPRDELRCAPTGDHPDRSCLTDADCGTSTPCEGGKVIGGFSNFGGTGRPQGIPLDFVLQDILHMRKSTPAVILAGPNLKSDTAAHGDDVQVVPVGMTVPSADTVVVAPGRNGVLDTPLSGDDFSSEGPRIVAGQNGVADTAASGDDVQVLPVGTTLLAAGTVVIAPGPNGVLDTAPANDDTVLGPDGILPGPDGAVQSVAQGDDVQVVPVGTTGVPEDTVVISAGQNGVLDTPLRGDDVAAVVTGYEVSKTCNANTPFAILAGPNKISDTQAETGICTIASPPHFVGESCSRTVANPDAGCGVSDIAPTSTVAADAAAGTSSLTLVDAAAFPSSGVITVGSQETRYTAKAGNVLTVPTMTCVGGTNPGTACTTSIQCTGGGTCTASAPVSAGAVVTLVTGRCTADTQVVPFGQSAGSANAIVVRPSTAQFLASVPGGDDVYIAPTIPCTQDADCSAGGSSGQCNGPQNVVRVEQRRNGQFRRFWSLLLSDNTEIQTDFGAILVRPGDAISLAFIQDIDRDGLIAQEEFLHGSSDFKKDTDGDGLGDFSEIRLGWDVGVVGQPIRHVFSDPTLRDTDGDGLTDKEEQDLRVTQCACDAIGPKSLLGSGGLLRGDAPADGGRPCRTDSDCVALGGTSCVDAVHCSTVRNVCAGGTNPGTACTTSAQCTGGGTCGEGCPPCSLDVTLNRTDPRLRDTDADGVTDFDEVFGYLTGAGIVDPSGHNVILAGANLRADTVACPENYCVEDADKPAAQRQHCMTDGDCFSRNCIHPVECDEVQVVTPGAGVRDARTAVVAPGPIGGLITTPSGLDALSGLGNEIAESRLQGDDQLVVGPGQSVKSSGQCADNGNFMLCSAIKPGPNGQIDSLRAGDDVVIPGGTGQKLEVSDPLNPDTDMDQIPDGNERLLGSSPNLPGDAIFGGDLDKDGLTDVLEDQGWKVQVTDANDVTSQRTVFSNPNLPDTDLDGLPDFAERNMPCSSPPTCQGACAGGSNSGKRCTMDTDCPGSTCPGTPRTCSNDITKTCTEATVASDCENICPTDPNNPDTDGDGISDFDELSAAQFAALARFNDFFPGYHVDGSTSKQYGTDPTRVDTDGDGLSDYFELFVGWTVVRADGSVQQVFSDPTKADTDGDGLPDNEEFAHRTDPRNADTDGDGRLDGLEVKIGTNPLQKDIFVNVTYSLLQLAGPQDGEDGLNDWRWRLSVQDSDQRFPGTTLSTDRTDCPVPFLDPNGFFAPAACMTNTYNFFLNRSAALTLTPNNGIVLNGLVVEIVDPTNDTQPIDVVRVDRCRMSFIDQPLTYDDLQTGKFITRTFNLTSSELLHDNTCKGLVVAEISVNCVGQGKGFCRVGNPCVTGDDCETGACGNITNGIGTCQSVCGNGTKEFVPESLTAAQQTACSIDSAFGIGSPNCEVCDDGNTSDCGRCNPTCGTVGAQGPKTCPVGTACVADADCTGTCDLTQPPTSGSCVGPGCGTCAPPQCGNGVIEAGETCDDGNALACGTCNATCSGTGTGTCPVGTGCTGNGVCASGTCVNKFCQAGSAGAPCTANADCLSVMCVKNFCQAGFAGAPCSVMEDCASMTCVSNICQPGPAGTPCTLDTDCTSGACVNKLCQPAAAGTGCSVNTDCASNLCVNFLCAAGGAGTSCTVNGDCASMKCVSNKCQPGGAGTVCSVSGDCTSMECVNNLCLAGAAGTGCSVNTDCASNLCVNFVCAAGGAGTECTMNGDCASMMCVNNQCQPGAAGTACTVDGDCTSMMCVTNLCQ